MAYTFKYGDRPLEGVAVQRAVGRGGFGEVYYAVTDSGKQVALKYLRENPEVELRGIAHVMNLKSPHLISIFDVRQNAAGDPFVLMEYISGPSLRELLNAAAPGGLGAEKAAFFLQGIGKGLAYLHERGIVHRDLKPANIFYDDGYVKIGDYGLSKHISVSKHSGQTVSVGTVHYMAPEIGSGNYSKAIDIYALGVILFEMLTGRLPYSGSSMGEILMRHLSDRPDLAGIPEPFARVIARALAKDPADRYQDVNEMVNEVIGFGEIGRDVASLDTSVFSSVPRAAAEQGEQRTITRGTPPVPPPLEMDARSPMQFGELDRRAGKRLEYLTRKLDQKTAKIERRFGMRRDRYSPRGAPKPNRCGDGGRTPRGSSGGILQVGLRSPGARIVHAMLLVGVAVGISFASAALFRRHFEETAAGTLMFILGGSMGALLAHFQVIGRLRTESRTLQRLTYALLGGACMIPAAAFASDEVNDHMAAVIAGAIASFLFCNWETRLERGRSGVVKAGDAFWPALVALIGSAIFDADDYVLLSAAVGGSISLLAQGAAAMWPHAAPPPAGDPIAAPPPPPPVPGAQMAQPPIEAAARDGAAPAAQSPAWAQGPGGAVGPPIVVEAAPSFVGRAASAATSFLGKLLMLAGMVFALAAPVLPGMIRYDLGFGESVGYSRVPRVIFVLPIGVGALLLVLARRRTGALHAARAVIGGLFLAGGAVLSVGPAAYGLSLLLGNGSLSPLQQDRVGAPVVATLVLVALGTVLMVWPKRVANRPIEI